MPGAAAGRRGWPSSGAAGREGARPGRSWPRARRRRDDVVVVQHEDPLHRRRLLSGTGHGVDQSRQGRGRVGGQVLEDRCRLELHPDRLRGPPPGASAAARGRCPLRRGTATPTWTCGCRSTQLGDPVAERRRLAEPGWCGHQRQAMTRNERGVELLDQSRARDGLRAPGRREQLRREHRSRHLRIIGAAQLGAVPLGRAVFADVMRSPGRPKRLRTSAGSSPVLPNQCGTVVSNRDLARPKDDVLVAEHEPHLAGKDVEPLVAVVRARFGRGLVGRDDDLPRLHAVGLTCQRHHRSALDPRPGLSRTRGSPTSGAARGRPAAPGRPATARAAAPGWADVVRSPAATACSSRCRSPPRRR